MKPTFLKRCLLAFALLAVLISLPAVVLAEANVEDQVAALKSSEPLSREMALVRLGQLGGRAREALPAVVPLLKDPELGVRISAVQTLGRIGGPAEVSGPALLAALDDPSESVRIAAMGGLRQLRWNREAVLQKLIAMTAHDTWPQRVAVADGLQLVRDLKDQPELELAVSNALLELLKDPYVLVRLSAARSLGGAKSGAEVAVPALMRAADDPEARVRREAVSSLGSFGEGAASASETLAKHLADEDHETRLRAARSLRAVNPTSALELLMTAMKSGDERVRSTAVASLGSYGREEPVVLALAGALKDGSADVRFRAVRALEGMGPAAKPALEGLIHTANDGNCIVREYACRALGSLGPDAASAMPVLIVLSQKDWHGGTRRAALAAMQAIEPMPAAVQ